MSTTKRSIKTRPVLKAQESSGDGSPRREPFVPPYSPSWFDRVMALIDRLPGGYGIWYGVFALLGFGLSALLRLAAGMPPFASNLTEPALGSFMLAFPAFLTHTLNRSADGAFADFEPALRAPQEAPLLRYRLTTAPAIPSLLSSLVGAGFGVLLVVVSPATRGFSEAMYGPALSVFFFAALAYFINSHFAYRLVYQLAQVSRIYAGHARVRLSDLAPHFALSRMTSRAAIAATLVVTGYMVGFAQVGDPTLAVAILLPNLALAVAAFVLPLTGAHRLLEAERNHWRREATQKLEAAVSELHQVIERGEFAAVPPVKDAISALDIELTRLARIPTWPWNPGTLRGVVATVFLPVAIWLVQFLLQQVLTG